MGMEDTHGNTTPPRRSPWADGVERPITPLQAMIGLDGGFNTTLANQVLAEPYVLAYLNRHLSRYAERNGHLPYDYQLRIERECAEPSEDGDADLRVALAIGYGVPDEEFDGLLEELGAWSARDTDSGALGGVTMGAVDFDRELDDMFAPVLLGDADGGAVEAGPSLGDTVGDWDVAFSSQRCRVLVRRDPQGVTLAVRLDYPDADGLRRITLHFADGQTLELTADVKGGVWRRGGIEAPADGLPVSCTVE